METLNAKMGDGVRLVLDRFDPVGPSLAASVMLLHGLSSNARFWWPVARLLSAMGVCTYTLDQRGHGRSEGAHTSMGVAASANDLLTVVRELPQGEPFAVVGQSWGASVALHYGALTADQPNVRPYLVGLVDGSFQAMARSFLSREEAMKALRPADIDGQPIAELETFFERRYPDWDPEVLLAARASFRIDANGLAYRRLNIDDHLLILNDLLDYEPHVDAGRLRSKLLLIPALSGHGEVDEVKTLAAERLLAEAPNQGWLYPVQGDHDLHAQYPERIAAIIFDSLSV
ncbi:alpha/beta hydrolase [Ferrimicrobium sp.]|uniref:alpha/beta fold hydrolase n=1 Tax=Ferrimicrobium sp. TaxID=2926050 RepID=UPI00261565BD|nr:alpha/beta hydrolase [Ferrimicrobium sp.]